MNLLASSHIVGQTLDDALDICHRAAILGWVSTLCPWSGPDEPLHQLMLRYRETLSAIARENLDCQLSLKTPDMKYDVGFVAELASFAAEHNVSLIFDAHSPESVEPTFRLIERVRSMHTTVGCTLPARWSRSKRDAERALALDLHIRIVRGQWKDAEGLFNGSKQRFLALINLLAGRAKFVTVATHHRLLAAEAVRRLQKCGTLCELEQMFGLPPISPWIVKRLNVRKRLYVSYGHAYLPYNSSDILRRPAIAGWMIRDIVLGRKGKLARFS